MRKLLRKLSLECIFVALKSRCSLLCFKRGKQRFSHIWSRFRVRGGRCRREMNSTCRLLFRRLPCCLGWNAGARRPALDHRVVRPSVRQCHPLEAVVRADVFCRPSFLAVVRSHYRLALLHQGLWYQFRVSRPALSHGVFRLAAGFAHGSTVLCAAIASRRLAGGFGSAEGPAAVQFFAMWPTFLQLWHSRVSKRGASFGLFPRQSCTSRTSRTSRGLPPRSPIGRGGRGGVAW